MGLRSNPVIQCDRCHSPLGCPDGCHRLREIALPTLDQKISAASLGDLLRMARGITEADFPTIVEGER